MAQKLAAQPQLALLSADIFGPSGEDENVVSLTPITECTISS